MWKPQEPLVKSRPRMGWPLIQKIGGSSTGVSLTVFLSPHFVVPRTLAAHLNRWLGRKDTANYTPRFAVPACQRGTGVVGGTRVELPSPPMNESLPPGDWGRAFCLVWVVGGYPPLGDLQGAYITGASAGIHVLYWLFSTTE